MAALTYISDLEGEAATRAAGHSAIDRFIECELEYCPHGKQIGKQIVTQIDT